ncbi:MAG: hypothetical protein ACRDWA_10425 [Acidimicrobiia bacterium]
MDFVFNDSPNFIVRNLRASRRAYELELLLDALLSQRITAPSARSRHHWVFAPIGSDPPVLWTNEGYIIPGFRFLVDEMPEVESGTLPLAGVHSEKYYDSLEGYSDTLTVPTTFESLLDAFDALAGDDRNRFLRACYWLHVAGAIWDYTQSLHLTSLINAIECLASVGSERSEPERPSRLFKDFMREYAPGSPSGTKLDRIYGSRSQIAHGERLLHYDQSPSGRGLSQEWATDREVGNDAFVLNRGAVVNWLWRNHLSSSENLLKRGLPTGKPATPGTKSGVTVITPKQR